MVASRSAPALGLSWAGYGSSEFRYTRWGGENFQDPVNVLLRTNRDE